MSWSGCGVGGVVSECVLFFFSGGRRHTSCYRDWSSDVCSSDLGPWRDRLFFYLGLPRLSLGILAFAGLGLRQLALDRGHLGCQAADVRILVAELGTELCQFLLDRKSGV